MKKKFALIPVIAAVIAGVMLFAVGCGTEGSYKHTVTGKDLKTEYPILAMFNVDDCSVTTTVTLGKDGKGSVETKFEGDMTGTIQTVLNQINKTTNFTYVVDGETVTITMGGTATEATLKGGVLTWGGVAYKK